MWPEAYIATKAKTSQKNKWRLHKSLRLWSSQTHTIFKIKMEHKFLINKHSKTSFGKLLATRSKSLLLKMLDKFTIIG